jgi:hypothetical protein
MATAATMGKYQPWKKFWPLKAELYSAEEREAMPWLSWKFDAKKPDERPWKEWMLSNQSTVVRRGVGSST